MVARPWSSSRLSCGERLLLRCDGNAGNSFPTTQGKDPSSGARRRKRVSSGCGQDSRASSSGDGNVGELHELQQGCEGRVTGGGGPEFQAPRVPFGLQLSSLRPASPCKPASWPLAVTASHCHSFPLSPSVPIIIYSFPGLIFACLCSLTRPPSQHNVEHVSCPHCTLRAKKYCLMNK